MQDNGADMGMDNDIDMGHESEHETLNRNELMKLSGKELAKMAQPYSTLKLNSLERCSKAKLCDIIMKKGEPKKSEEPKARTARTSSETEQFLETALVMLDVMKQNRDGEPLNATAKDIFKKQAVVYADEKIAEDKMNIDKANTALFVISTTALLFDGIIGFKNAPPLFNKIKNKFFQGAKKEKANDSK